MFSLSLQGKTPLFLLRPSANGVAVIPRSDRLEEVLEEIKVHNQNHCQFLLDKAAAGSDYLLVWILVILANFSRPNKV